MFLICLQHQQHTAFFTMVHAHYFETITGQYTPNITFTSHAEVLSRETLNGFMVGILNTIIRFPPVIFFIFIRVTGHLFVHEQQVWCIMAWHFWKTLHFPVQFWPLQPPSLGSNSINYKSFKSEVGNYRGKRRDYEGTKAKKQAPISDWNLVLVTIYVLFVAF